MDLQILFMRKMKNKSCQKILFVFFKLDRGQEITKLDSQIKCMSFVQGITCCSLFVL